MSPKINYSEERKIHPELRSAEIFLGNHCIESFKRLEYKTKRMGSVAYERDGKLIKQDLEPDENKLFPVFVKTSEHDSKK